MEDKFTIHFLSFADKRLQKSLDRIKREAIEFGIFSKIWTLNESDFDSWYIDRYKDRFGEHGFGYWQWKSYLMSRYLDRMSSGDILLYVDAGCELNHLGIKRFFEYVDLVNKSKSGVLVFKQGLKTKQYTKGDVFHFFDVASDLNYTEKEQIAGGVIMVKKCWNAVQCIEEWNYIAHEHHELLIDAPSLAPNFDGFIEHRHDQSVLDMLSVKYGFVTVDASEIWTDKGWNTMLEYPIWAARNKEYTQIMPLKKRVKRFIKRLVRFK